MGCIASKQSKSNQFSHVEDSMHASMKKSVIKRDGKPAPTAFVPRKDITPPAREVEDKPQPVEDQ
eukprot:CAMPEP_0194073448 /NCGR_PEP_ID=MMETSP0149-20130528/882_1 /TAXON_ID=122233 /ORGANISM="Chaetoceros debilis, Strain MM31A-1" /LENGTH=64 /DNA_ID=CAMNT_0038753473 /DNA_START=286 /DNA_END=480 /DNA_ORIENTATION=+